MENSSSNLKFVRTLRNAYIPEQHDKNNQKFIGYDLKTPEGLFIQPNEVVKINTGIAFEMDLNALFFPKIFDISFVATDKNSNIQGGIIDLNYRGSILVALRNIGDDVVFFERGDVIGQILFLDFTKPTLVEITPNIVEAKSIVNTNPPYVKFFRTLPHAFIPENRDEGSIGYDLKTPRAFFIKPKELVKIDIGIALKMDLNQSFFPNKFDRSSVSANKKVNVEGSVINLNNQDSIVVSLRNNGDDIVFFERGDAIAQMIFLNFSNPTLVEVKSNFDKVKSVDGKYPSYVNFFRTLPDAYIPEKYDKGYYGYDLKICKSFFIKPKEVMKIDIGIGFEMDLNQLFFPKLFDLFSVLSNKNVKIQGDVIELSKRDSIVITLRNNGHDVAFFERGESIAQIIFLNFSKPTLVEIDTIDMNTERGNRGFGGTTFI